MAKNKKSQLNEKLDLILNNQKKILENESKILGEEQKIENLEKKSLKNEKNELKEEEEVLDELEKLENEFKENIISSPMKNITKQDIVKGFIGAFVGVMSHFAFSYASKIAETLTFLNSTVLYIVAFLIIILMLYYSGFRNIEKRILLKFMPLRALVLYSVSIFTVIFVNLLFGKIDFPINYLSLYNLIGASIILAVMGAGTADLIGKK